MVTPFGLNLENVQADVNDARSEANEAHKEYIRVQSESKDQAVIEEARKKWEAAEAAFTQARTKILQ